MSILDSSMILSAQHAGQHQWPRWPASMACPILRMAAHSWSCAAETPYLLLRLCYNDVLNHSLDAAHSLNNLAATWQRANLYGHDKVFDSGDVEWLQKKSKTFWADNYSTKGCQLGRTLLNNWYSNINFLGHSLDGSFTSLANFIEWIGTVCALNMAAKLSHSCQFPRLVSHDNLAHTQVTKKTSCTPKQLLPR